jgi:3-keto-5-aminohexanoate cleavage enzyme|tara:strand:- start:51256 stop:52164 length:909 start_codon:yes stop_codon:yes gene_type:complete
MTRKVILTIAPTGGMAHKNQNPNLPTQPEEIANDVHDCYNAGASVVAIHARRTDNMATCNPEIYREINRRIREKCDIIINNSTGGGVHGDLTEGSENSQYQELIWEERIKGMDAKAEMCTLDPTTIICSFDKRELLMHTSPSRCEELAKGMQQRGIKPEWEVFSPTHLVQDVNRLIEMGYDKPPYFINIVLNAHRGFQGAMPYTAENLQMMTNYLPNNSIFCVSGIGDAQLPCIANSLLLGGHVRVGLEDNLYYGPKKLASNVELTERAVRIVRELGYEIASPDEAREIIGLSEPVGAEAYA